MIKIEDEKDPFYNEKINEIIKKMKSFEAEIESLKKERTMYEEQRKILRKFCGERFPCPYCFNSENGEEVEYYTENKIVCPACRKIYTEALSYERKRIENRAREEEEKKEKALFKEEMKEENRERIQMAIDMEKGFMEKMKTLKKECKNR